MKAGPGITINSCVERPRSKGSIRLASARPEDQPLVDPNYLSDPEDVRLSIGGVRRAREIMAQSPLREMIDREIFPGPALQSDEELAAHARRVRMQISITRLTVTIASLNAGNWPYLIFTLA